MVNPILTYENLRREGIRYLERIAGDSWTDFNAHDPGITILEQICFALSDLGYRLDHGLPDLLAEGGADPYEDLYSPPEILTCEPTTLLDYRRLILDIDGVRNAWIEKAEAPVPAHYSAATEELSLAPQEQISEPLSLRGLYRISIELSDSHNVERTTVRAEVAKELHTHRGLCEDFIDIRILEFQPIRVTANLEIDPLDDVQKVSNALFEKISSFLSPPVHFESVGRKLHEGMAIDEVYEGPLLRNGFLEAGGLEPRRQSLRTSDLIRELMAIPGVRGVRYLLLGSGERGEPWVLPLDPNRTPRLDLASSEIQLTRGEHPLRLDTAKARIALEDQLSRCSRSSAHRTSENEGALPPGRDRQVGRYRPLRELFPDLYGIGAMGLPESASAQRRAQAKGLEAYLMLFDQILANTFTQLAHTRDFFSHAGPSLETNFTQELEDPGDSGASLFTGPAEERHERLRAIAKSAQGSNQGSRRRGEMEASLAHKNRWLNHLLARFAESLGQDTGDETLGDSAATPGVGLARRKQSFLQNYRRISGARGAGVDILDADARVKSGYERRLELALGLRSEADEEFLVVEHIFLRPVAEDVLPKAESRPNHFLTRAGRRDPFSCQLSLIFRSAGRLADLDFRRRVEEVVRRETPAHLTPFLLWVPPKGWADFAASHRVWRRELSAHTSAHLGLRLADSDSPIVESRGEDSPGAWNA